MNIKTLSFFILFFPEVFFFKKNHFPDNIINFQKENDLNSFN